MKKRKPKSTIKANPPQSDLLPISSIASQILEDVEHIYKLFPRTPKIGEQFSAHTNRPIENGSSVGVSLLAKIIKQFASMLAPVKPSHSNNHSSAKPFECNIANPKKGELIVIATRSKILREEFQLCLTQRLAMTLNQLVAIYSASDSFIQFTRKLAGIMANIPADTDIYAGQLNDAEILRLTSVLAELNASHIFMYPLQMIQLEKLYDTSRKLQHHLGEIGLVVVDAVQYLLDKKHRCIDTQQSLIKLKALAEELKVPVVVIYQLDPAIENHPTTFTRNELREVEKLATLTDGFMLMSGTRDDLAFALPKILNAKSVEWLDQIRDFTWNKPG